MLEKSKNTVAKRKEKDPEYNNKRNLKEKHARIKRKFGLTTEEWWSRFEEQGSCCSICRSTKTAGQGWHTDHCHASGKLRDILCYHCNLLLGMAKDNTETLKQAINYLERHDSGR
jgi:hypothetical protein